MDDADRRDLRDRLAHVIPDCGASIPAWALLGNHFHIVVRTGPVSLSKTMARILGGYAMRFNRRHEKGGYVFQGRFGSRIIRGDDDLMNIIRYVHRNPLEAGIVGSIDSLASYPWSGHAALSGRRRPFPFEAPELALSAFHTDAGVARSALDAWMRIPDSTAAAPDPFLALVAEVCRPLGVTDFELQSGARSADVSRARMRICQRATDELGLSRSEIARRLAITRTAVVLALRRSGAPVS